MASVGPSPLLPSIMLSLRCHSDFDVSETACVLASCKLGLTMDITTCNQMTSCLVVRQLHKIFKIPITSVNRFCESLVSFVQAAGVLAKGCVFDIPLLIYRHM